MGDHWRKAPPGVCIHLGVAASSQIFMHTCPWISHSLRPSHEFPTACRACSRESPKRHNVCSIRLLIAQCATLFLGLSTLVCSMTLPYSVSSVALLDLNRKVPKGSGVHRDAVLDWRGPCGLELSTQWETIGEGLPPACVYTLGSRRVPKSSCTPVLKISHRLRPSHC